MKEKLIIRNFGPIKDVELELGKFNVLIGEQATGKSTVTKLLAVCRYFSYIVPNDEWEGSNFLGGLNDWGLSEFIQQNTFIDYQCRHYSFQVNITTDNKLKTEYGLTKIPIAQTNLNPLSEEFKALLRELERIKPQQSKNKSQWLVPTSFYQNDASKVLDNPLYLPTERGLQSIFSLGKSSIQNISDSLFNQFAKLDQMARFFKEEILIEPLNIIYKNVDGRGYIRKKNDDKFYSLFNGASGYQSTIPIALAIKYYTEQRLKRKKKTFIIEEPELNLFPSAQADLMKFFADQIQFHNGILLTTHSPYILTSVNNLMYAYNVGSEHADEVDKIIPKLNWLDPNDVFAYRLLPNGKCEDIFDREENLIHADKIDEISRTLNKQFDDLLKLQYSKHESYSE